MQLYMHVKNIFVKYDNSIPNNVTTQSNCYYMLSQVTNLVLYRTCYSELYEIMQLISTLGGMILVNIFFAESHAILLYT